MKVYVHKQHFGVQVFPEPEDKSEWYETEVDSLDDIEGKIYDPSTESFVTDLQALADRAREERDRRLNATDWVVVKAQETGTPVPTEWKNYRQALRDITLQEGFPTDVKWPNPPE